MDNLIYVDDNLIIAMVQVSLDLRYSRIFWMLILYFNLIPYCLSKATLRVMIEYNLRCLKVIEYTIKDLPLPIKGEYTYGLLSGSLLRNLWPKWKFREECLQVHN